MTTTLDLYAYREALTEELWLAFWDEAKHPRDEQGRFDFVPSLKALARTVTDAIGVDPFDVDVDKLWDHVTQHERTPKSRFRFGSPCQKVKKIDFAVHVWLPGILREDFPELADRLNETSPRWGKRNFPVVNPVRTEPLNP